MGGLEYGLEPEIVDRIAAEVRDVAEMGVEICLVIGGGNIFVASQVPLGEWTGRPRITWACWLP